MANVAAPDYARKPMRLAVIAPELPPSRGGMEALASGLVSCLGAMHEVTVFTLPGHGVPGSALDVRPALTGDLASDSRAMAASGASVFMTLNAGWIGSAPHLRRPFFAYVHGNDFIRPWTPRAPRALRIWNAVARKLGRSAERLAASEQRWRLARIRDGVPHVSGVFANSRYTGALFAQAFGFPAGRIHVVPPGIDPGFLQDSCAGRSPVLRVLTVARLSSSNRRKNVDSLIEAIRLLGHELAISLVIVGTGDDRPRLARLVETLGLESRVSLLGEVSSDELRRLYRESDLFALVVRPDPSDVEGYGMTYVEAAGAGVPVIATDTGGVAEAVRDGVTGLFAHDPSPAGIAEAIMRFLRGRDRFDAAAAREFARGRTISATAELIADQIAAATPGSRTP